jgi:hypothetical protein
VLERERLRLAEQAIASSFFANDARCQAQTIAQCPRQTGDALPRASTPAICACKVAKPASSPLRSQISPSAQASMSATSAGARCARSRSSAASAGGQAGQHAVVVRDGGAGPGDEPSGPSAAAGPTGQDAEHVGGVPGTAPR